jgi:hypothetical protein
MQFAMRTLEILRGLAQKLGPYVILEVLLPGGTLYALLLFLYRRGRTKLGPAARPAAAAAGRSPPAAALGDS